MQLGRELGLEQVKTLLHQSLEEEREADQRLTRIAKDTVNQKVKH